VKIDTTPPTLSTETFQSPSGTDINAGKTVTFTVTMSEPVIVTDGGSGLPTLTLNDNEVATYTGPVGPTATMALTFSYTVRAGDNVADLQATAIKLPAGATIQDGAGNNANLTGFATIDTGIKVDTKAPGATIETFKSPSGTDINANKVVTFTVDMSQAVTGHRRRQRLAHADTERQRGRNVHGSGRLAHEHADLRLHGSGRR
jgi:hypothetical protein